MVVPTTYHPGALFCTQLSNEEEVNVNVDNRKLLQKAAYIGIPYMRWVHNVRCDITVSLRTTSEFFLSKRSGGRLGSSLGESESPLSVGRTYHGLQDSVVMPNSDHLEGRERNESEYMPNTSTASDALKTRYCGKIHITVSTRGTSDDRLAR